VGILVEKQKKKQKKKQNMKDQALQVPEVIIGN